MQETDNGMNAKWDNRFMSLAREIATWSKDRSTKIGAVLVGPNKEIRSTGYNGFPRMVEDSVEERHQRPTKYFFTEHAERNIIYHAARTGVSTEGCIIYVCGRPPCADCARAIIQAGIKEVIVETMEHKSRPEIDWEGNTKAATEMLREAGIIVRVVEKEKE
jgi:dCMP deaminase